MSVRAERALEKVQARIAAIQQAIAGLEYLCSGTVLKRTKVCSHASCRCHTERAARHGPYYEWGFMQDGKLRHRMISPERAQLLSLAIANHRKVKKLLKAWEAQTVRLIELNVPE